MQIIYNDHKRIADFVSLHLFGSKSKFQDYKAIGFEDADGCLSGGVIYHHFHANYGSIELTAYSRKPFMGGKEALKLMFDYPLVQLGCRIAIVRTSADNKRVRRIMNIIGAHETLIPDLRGEGKADVYLVLKATKWLQSAFAQQVRFVACPPRSSRKSGATL